MLLLLETKVPTTRYVYLGAGEIWRFSGTWTIRVEVLLWVSPCFLVRESSPIIMLRRRCLHGYRHPRHLFMVCILCAAYRVSHLLLPHFFVLRCAVWSVLCSCRCGCAHTSGGCTAVVHVLPHEIYYILVIYPFSVAPQAKLSTDTAQNASFLFKTIR